MFLRIAVQPFQAGDFVNISLMFWGFEAHFHTKVCTEHYLCVQKKFKPPRLMPDILKREGLPLIF